MNVKFGRWFWSIVIFFTLAGMALPVMAEEKLTSEDKTAGVSEKKTSEDKVAGVIEKHASGKVAVVNGTVIRQDTFDRELDAVRQRFMMQGQKLDDSRLPTIKKNVLENLIHRELLYQESQKSGVKIENKAVDEKFGDWKKQFPDEAQFKSIMGMMNLTEEVVRSQIRQQMAVEEFIDKKFADKIAVSDKETKDYYDANPDFFKQPEQIKASHILIKVDTKADDTKKAEARKKMEGFQEQLKKGGDFAAIAKESSECPSNAKGGDLGYFKRGQMVKPFEDAAFALKTGEMSDIVETRFGYHLIKTTDKKAETTSPYEEVRERLADYLKQEKKLKEVNLYASKLKEESKIERFIE
ncbi:peptidylprolyl isomerase [Desulfobacterales bacterium HSG2]|nr:peptidylprolyl isomerase [Desulfobacterales bacterium HSG2]